MSNSYTTQGSRPDLINNITNALGFAPKKSQTVAPVQQSSSAPRVGVSSLNTLQTAGMIPKPTSQPVTKGLIQSHSPSTPVKSITDAAGNRVDFHAESKPVVPKPEAPKPAAIDPASNARRVISAGEQTPQEKTATDNLYRAGQPTQLESHYIDEVMQAKRMTNAGNLGRYADAEMYVGKGPEQLYKGLIEAPDLEGRADANRGLYNTFGDIYGSAATEGLKAANTIAGRGLSAAQAGLTGAQTTAERAQGGAENVLSTSVNPLFGEVTGTLQSAVQNVVSRLQNGTMTYEDAKSALSGYGQAGLNALNQSLPQGFNVAQSNTLAGQQGSVNVNYQLADTALKNVEDIMSKLGAAQTTNIPIINKGANWISTQFGVGSEQTRAMTGAVQSLRNAYASLLASVKGGTPTDYSNQAAAEIPPEPTPNDIAAIRHNFETLGQARKDILGNPGQAGTSTSSGGGFAEVW